MTQYSSEITKLLEDGARSYAAKKYEVAVEHYGEACQLFSQGHDGEEDPELLFLYGKALFQVAVSRNGLFGGDTGEAANIARAQDEERNDEKAQTNGMFTFSEDVPLAEEEDDSGDEEEKEGDGNGAECEDNESDEDRADDDNEAEQHEGQQEEEQSDFEIAWEILDLARTLFQSKLPSEAHDPPENAGESSDPVIKCKVKISEIYDLLGEISLETENFKQAADDFESLLKVRETIYPFESNLISEAHYKLSLALEFNFDNGDAKTKSIEHLQNAIESIKQKQAAVGTDKDDDLIQDLEIRLKDLQKDPNEVFDQQKQDIIKGILGESTASDYKTTIPTSTPAVNDLTSVVKKRKAKPTSSLSKKSKN